MRQLFGLLALFILCPFAHGEQDPADLFELLKIDRGAFARRLTSDLSNDFEKADSIVTWLATNLEWKATDYQQRTVQQIIDRKGGNCNELAQVAISLFEELEMPMRRVRESL